MKSNGACDNPETCDDALRSILSLERCVKSTAFSVHRWHHSASDKEEGGQAFSWEPVHDFLSTREVVKEISFEYSLPWVSI